MNQPNFGLRHVKSPDGIVLGGCYLLVSAGSTRLVKITQAPYNWAGQPLQRVGYDVLGTHGYNENISLWDVGLEPYPSSQDWNQTSHFLRLSRFRQVNYLIFRPKLRPWVKRAAIVLLIVALLLFLVAASIHPLIVLPALLVLLASLGGFVLFWLSS